MLKRNWYVKTPGHESFPMIQLGQPMDHISALAFARSIWPQCTVE